jgi:hypothetical protein
LLLQPLTTTWNRIFGSICGSVSSSSISALQEFDPIPVIHSTKCKPRTCKLTDGMSVPRVAGVKVLISWQVGHGVFETLQDTMPHIGRWRRSLEWMSRRRRSGGDDHEDESWRSSLDNHKTVCPG